MFIDILHSYLGLAALSLMKEPGLKTVDPVMCISLGAREYLDQLSFAANANSAQKSKMSHHDDEGEFVVEDKVYDKYRYMSISGG